MYANPYPLSKTIFLDLLDELVCADQSVIFSVRTDLINPPLFTTNPPAIFDAFALHHSKHIA